MEQQTFSLYTIVRPASKLNGGRMKQFYYCNRSFNYCKKGKNIRKIKSGGSYKIGKACPSLLDVSTWECDGSVLVKFWKTHCGHSEEIGRTPLVIKQ